jgi:uncharacterized membrane protein
VNRRLSLPPRRLATGRRERGHRDERAVEFSRIVNFSDAVFAIAITLLVLTLEVPESSEDLGQELADQLPDLLAYAISFAVLAKLWVIHHRFFGGLEEFDGNLIAINLFYLAWVAIVPFSSELVGDYGDETHAVVVYAVNMAGLGLISAWMRTYAVTHRLVTEQSLDSFALHAGAAAFAMPALFLLSIPVAFLSPLAATLIWPLVFVAGPRFTEWISVKRKRDEPEAPAE